MTDQEFQEKLNTIEPMIWKFTNMVVVPDLEKEDIRQELLLYLWKVVILKYDPAQNMRFTSFAYFCLKQKVMDMNRKAASKKQAGKLKKNVSLDQILSFDGEELHPMAELAVLQNAVSLEEEVEYRELMRFVYQEIGNYSEDTEIRSMICDRMHGYTQFQVAQRYPAMKETTASYHYRKFRNQLKTKLIRKDWISPRS